MNRIYKDFYSKKLPTAVLNNIRENICNAKKIICVAGGSTANDRLDLVACANCFAVFNETELNKPRFLNKAWWYYTKGKSFGFSPIEKINLKAMDMEEEQGEFRLSWHIDAKTGGGRLGKIFIGEKYKNKDDYLKYIFVN
jgi:hypothetical protein